MDPPDCGATSAVQRRPEVAGRSPHRRRAAREPEGHSTHLGVAGVAALHLLHPAVPRARQQCRRLGRRRAAVGAHLRDQGVGWGGRRRVGGEPTPRPAQAPSLRSNRCAPIPAAWGAATLPNQHQQRTTITRAPRLGSFPATPASQAPTSVRPGAKGTLTDLRGGLVMRPPSHSCSDLQRAQGGCVILARWLAPTPRPRADQQHSTDGRPQRAAWPCSCHPPTHPPDVQHHGWPVQCLAGRLDIHQRHRRCPARQRCTLLPLLLPPPQRKAGLQRGAQPRQHCCGRLPACGRVIFRRTSVLYGRAASCQLHEPQNPRGQAATPTHRRAAGPAATAAAAGGQAPEIASVAIGPLADSTPCLGPREQRQEAGVSSGAKLSGGLASRGVFASFQPLGGVHEQLAISVARAAGPAPHPCRPPRQVSHRRCAVLPPTQAAQTSV